MKADKIELIRQKAWIGAAPLPERVRDFPTMLVAEEQKMLHWLAGDYFEGTGAICDLGAFLGGSTVALAGGAYKNVGDQARVHSYDFFRLQPAAWVKWDLERHAPYPEDGSSLPVTRQMLGPLGEYVTFNAGDFCEKPAPEGPIEILFIDLAKTMQTSDHILNAFFPKLMPGKSIVVQQDYFFIWPMFDIFAMEVLSDYFEPLSSAGTSALCLNTRQLDLESVRPALSQSMTVEGIQAALARAAERWPPDRQGQFHRLMERARHMDRVPNTRAEFSQMLKRQDASPRKSVLGRLARTLQRGRR